MSNPSTEPAKRVAVGMSGGLDSSAVASLMRDQGHDVIGLTLHMFKEGSRCCSLEDIERARALCEHLGIRHYVVNVVEAFQESIIKPFVEEYARGRTPSPCVLCNEFIKFGALMERALQLDCTHVATGHYVRIEQQDDGWHLFKARDEQKDQSYFLHRLSQDQLRRSVFPLESMTKSEVAEYARAKELPVRTSSDAESQDLCFVTNDGHAPFVEQFHPELRKPGEIVDIDGTVRGTHMGFHQYTIGQRKGMGIAAPNRLYVKQLDPEQNRVIVGNREDLSSSGCIVENVHWTAPAPLKDGDTCTVRIRYRHPGVNSTIQYLDDKTIRLSFDAPQFAVAPGQAAVLYNGDEVLGGGWIAGEEWEV